jgi:phosphoribosylformylglycinamidine synthase
VGAGAVDVRHITEIYEGGIPLHDYSFLVMIGGFMDGDDLGGGRACANRFRYRQLPGQMGGGTFLERLQDFIAQGRLVLGICNGFQVLVKLGLLPGHAKPDLNYRPAQEESSQTVSLTNNARGRFENRWVHLRVDPASPCIYTKGLDHLELPIRHGEGRLVGKNEPQLASLVEGHLSPLRYSLPDGEPTEEYPANPNGSPFGIASLCNSSGTVMGLMPHPEAFNHFTNHPQWTRKPFAPDPDSEDGDGLALFRNAYAYLAAEGYSD